MGGPVNKRDPLDWSIIFDLVASEYGYTWEQFKKLTYKFLDACLIAIERRTHNKLVYQAAMRGIKMDLYRRHKPVSKKTLEFARNEAEKILKANREAKKSGR